MSLSKPLPFLDPKGLLRMGGRLDKASLSYNIVQHPVILPGCHASLLMLQKSHEELGHLGSESILARSIDIARQSGNFEDSNIVASAIALAKLASPLSSWSQVDSVFVSIPLRVYNNFLRYFGQKRSRSGSDKVESSLRVHWPLLAGHNS